MTQREVTPARWWSLPVATFGFEEGNMGQHGQAVGQRQPVRQQRSGGLEDTLVREIIPRLVLAHRSTLEESACISSRGAPTEAELTEFANLAVTGDLDAALEFVERFAAEGVGLEAIFRELIGPTARLLGTQWALDLCSFTAVTTGSGLLQRLVQVLGPAFAPDRSHRGLCVLVGAPGEQHTLGLFLLGEHLRRAGWGVELVPGMTRAELLSLVATTPVTMVGFSVSVTDHLAGLEAAIAAVRAGSFNSGLPILVGGSLDLSAFAARNGVTNIRDPDQVIEWMDGLARDHSPSLLHRPKRFGT